jgi:CSLREA domain-containing protein
VSRKLLLALVLATAMSLLVAGNVRGSPETFTVNSTGDAPDSDTTDGICDDGTGACTLRAAIEQANATPGTDTISFNVPGVGPHTIQPASALPTVTDAVIIDGYTQPGATPNTNPPQLGSNAVLKIELDGANAGAQTNGLTITAGSSTVRGVVINRFGSGGVLRVGGGNVVLQGNFIGIDVTGTADLGNGANGIYLEGSPNSTIGGTTPEARNVISGNDFRGVFFDNSSGVVVQGNLIGTNAAGTTELGNRWEGISVYNGSNNTIGGTTAGAGNVISGNVVGVEIGYSATSNLVQGNLIGMNVAGTAALGNHLLGVVIGTGATNNTIGGPMSGAGNIIAYTKGYAGWGQGVYVDGTSTTANSIRGNSIYSNARQGIDNANGGNTELAPPIIDSAAGSVSGHTDPRCFPCIVEVFSDDEDEGRIYHGSTATNDDATGTWMYTGSVTGPNITATITDADGNTSEFSVPFSIVTPSPTPTPTATSTPTDTPTPTAMPSSTPTPTAALPVGGIAELARIPRASAQEAGVPAGGSGRSAGGYAALAGGLAVAVLVAAAGASYARRRWLR